MPLRGQEFKSRANKQRPSLQSTVQSPLAAWVTTQLEQAILAKVEPFLREMEGMFAFIGSFS